MYYRTLETSKHHPAPNYFIKRKKNEIKALKGYMIGKVAADE